VLTGGGSITVNKNVEEFEDPTLSDTITVKDVAVNKELGLPPTSPVLTFNVIVAGNEGLML
jgi:hypothetical protein